MREYKFRGKRKDNGEWVYGDLISNKNRTAIYDQGGLNNVGKDFISLTALRVDPSTVGQYTGFKDKNGKEIYEGDIIKAKTFNYPLCIEWDRGECAFVMRSTHSGATYGFMWEIEIIGNIYDNPELMKEGSV